VRSGVASCLIAAHYISKIVKVVVAFVYITLKKKFKLNLHILCTKL